MKLLGLSHLLALAGILAGALLIVRTGRKARRNGQNPEKLTRILAWTLLIAQVIDPVIAWRGGYLTLAHALPLELCDAAAFAGIVALWTRRQLAFELLYFWGLSGTVQAVLTPALGFDFPHPDAFRYFVFHAGIVWAALLLAPGLGMRPRRHAAGRVFGWTLVYAAGVGLIDWAVDANYMFLSKKPPGSVLEPFGRWPHYLLGAAGIGLLLFWLLEMPYARQQTDGDVPAKTR